MLETMMTGVKFNPGWKSDTYEMLNTLAYGSAGLASDKRIYFLGRLNGGTNPYGIYSLYGTAIIPIVTNITGILFGARMFVVGMNCFVIGFGSNSTENRQVRMFDLNARIWRVLPSTYTRPLAWSAISTYKNSAYFCGSGARNDTRITRLQIDGNGLGFSQINYPTTNVNRSHMLIAANEEYIYYGAGFDDTLSTTEFFKDFYKLRKSDLTITRLADLPEAGYFGCSYGIYGDHIVAINPMSGTNSSATATFSNKTFIYNIPADKWEIAAPGPTNFNMAQCAFNDNYFYRIGGRNSGAVWSNTIDRLGPF